MFQTKKETTFKSKESNSTHNEVAYTAECFMNAAKSLHKLHLKVKGQESFASHSALNGYDAFHGFADQLIENYQGATETIVEIPCSVDKNLNSIAEAITYLKEMKEEVTSLQSKLPYSEIINQLDIVKEHINSMVYKLKFLQ